MDEGLLTALKALSDVGRLRMLGLLASGERLTVRELVDRVGLPHRTVVHHLDRLSRAGLVRSFPRPPHIVYEFAVDRLGEMGAALGRLSTAEESEDGPSPIGPDGQPRPEEDARVLHAFFSGSRLEQFPARSRKQLIVLRYLAETVFEPDREYPEKEVNQRLALHHDDVASLRRYLVDNGFMSRDHGVYRRTPLASWPVAP